MTRKLRCTSNAPRESVFIYHDDLRRPPDDIVNPVSQVIAITTYRSNPLDSGRNIRNDGNVGVKFYNDCLHSYGFLYFYALQPLHSAYAGRLTPRAYAVSPFLRSLSIALPVHYSASRIFNETVRLKQVFRRAFSRTEISVVRN